MFVFKACEAGKCGVPTIGMSNFPASITQNRVIPENNLILRYQVPAPDMIQTAIEEAWKSQLKEPEKYNVMTPQQLLKPLIFDNNYRTLITCLNKRYW